MTDWQERVVAERYDLFEKVEKLRAFVGGEGMKGLPYAEQMRLQDQLYHMRQYLGLLTARISAFGSGAEG